MRFFQAEQATIVSRRHPASVSGSRKARRVTAISPRFLAKLPSDHARDRCGFRGLADAVLMEKFVERRAPMRSLSVHAGHPLILTPIRSCTSILKSRVNGMSRRPVIRVGALP